MTEPQSTRTRTRPGADTIVVGVDGSQPSIEALLYAVKLGDALGKRVEAIAVWHPSVSVYDVYSPEPGWSPESEAHQILRDALAKAFGDIVPDELNAATLEGRTAPALIEVSAGSEMLVLGSRGHGGFAGLMLGSVSAACAAHARCPVLITHHGRPESRPEPT